MEFVTVTLGVLLVGAAIAVVVLVPAVPVAIGGAAFLLGRSQCRDVRCHLRRHQ